MGLISVDPSGNVRPFGAEAEHRGISARHWSTVGTVREGLLGTRSTGEEGHTRLNCPSATISPLIHKRAYQRRLFRSNAV